ncbi:MAG TPA: TonB-dependent receptor plug domain-containing protein [Gemmatimonadaceae bacterium]|nr:TonB-dependent receptor plug domain-containing protein [Gemmatimonadaceae bacterium]
MNRTGIRTPIRSLASIALLAGAACSAHAPKQNDSAPAPKASTSSTSDATIKNDNKQVFSSVVEMIRARAPGVQVVQAGDTYALRIRGVSSAQGINDPLIVIDGTASSLPGTRALDSLNPNDVQKIEVLKDAASTAFYGLRGGSGVILITTRKQ